MAKANQSSAPPERRPSRRCSPLLCALGFFAAAGGGVLLSDIFKSRPPNIDKSAVAWRTAPPAPPRSAPPSIRISETKMRAEVDRIESGLAVLNLISESVREELTVDFPLQYLPPVEVGDHLTITISPAAFSEVTVQSRGETALLRIGRGNARPQSVELPLWALPEAAAPGSHLQLLIRTDPDSREAARVRIRDLRESLLAR